MHQNNKTLSDGERAKRLQLLRTPNVGPMTYAQLMSRFSGDIDAVLDALPNLTTRAGKHRDFKLPSLSIIEREIDKAHKIGARFIAYDEADYPLPLNALTPPPPMICVRGKMEAFLKPGIAIVGARNASAAGRKLTRDISHELAKSGYTIVSGLARGIDGEAHAAALQTGHTIAVLAGGVDAIYPPEHAKLYDAILERGAIVSESPLGYIATAKDFPKRNRIITGLSMAVLVAEAALRSGSLISARVALEQGREVLAIPGSPLDERTRGSNGLLRQGAWLVENAEDVIAALENSIPPMLAEPEAPTFETLSMIDVSLSTIQSLTMALSPTPTHIDELVRVVRAPLREVNAALTELELDGIAQTHAGGYVSTVIE
ncbi:DNA-processing protein DprA [Hirschia baltica]|uniref:DNA protecting protein DprA n=1 Tax=Hirschia baltica (strain ATCC 49814 / DSM 5838 / IFAM 1418) TaxID=582402 RepID=C6XL72_HIRBI|nr:DNA-processing protein DprA [Hirschia baltica]ACT59671.1 DNA protecting protein DprA [Hirschia baltica ATCC 49814]